MIRNGRGMRRQWEGEGYEEMMGGHKETMGGARGDDGEGHKEMMGRDIRR